MATCKEAHALTPVCFQVSVFLCNNRSTEQVTQPHAEVNISHQHLETVYLPFLKLCSECVVQLCVLFIYLSLCLPERGKKGKIHGAENQVYYVSYLVGSWEH